MMDGCVLNAKLNNYFEDHVQLTHTETFNIIEDVMQDVDDVVKKISELCPLFGATVQGIGSYYQGLKVKRADEFDLNIPLKSIGPLCCCSTNTATYYTWGMGMECPLRHFDFYHPNDSDTFKDRSRPKDLKVVRTSTHLPVPDNGYETVYLPSNSAAGQKYNSHPEALMFDGYLIPFLIKRHLMDLLDKALTSRNLSDCIQVDRSLHGPAITLAIVYENNQGKRIKINVDIAVIIRARLPFSERQADWMQRARASGWPTAHKISEIIQTGINLVAKKNFDWQKSFAECEKVLVRDMDADGCIRKKVHRIMKSLCQEACKDYPKRELSSYILKNAWLLECERLPSPQYWMPPYLGERLEECITRLEIFVASKSVPLYFDRSVNLLKNKDLEMIKRIIWQMKMKLQ